MSRAPSGTIKSKFVRHSYHQTGVCKYWKPNPKWQVPPEMVGNGEQKGVLCDKFSVCEDCGWNPAVAKRRLKELKGGKL